MILLLNTTKTMDLTASVPTHLKVTEPQQMEMTHILADRISKMSSSQLKKLMSLSAKLAIETRDNVVVHAKEARGALVRYALVNNAQTPQDLMRFNSMGWKATKKPPMAGTWLFTRPET